MEQEPTDISSSSLNRDEIMSHFQEITDFYDVEQSQAILESTNWNLGKFLFVYRANSDLLLVKI